MERRVETRDAGRPRQELARGRDTGQRGGHVQRSQVGDRDEVLDDVAVDADALRVARPAVDDAVADRLDALHAMDGVRELRGVHPPLGDLELTLGQDPVVGIDDAYLERARAGVEDEDSHPLALSAATPS